MTLITVCYRISVFSAYEKKSYESRFRVSRGRLVIGNALHESNKARVWWLLEKQSDNSTRESLIMHRKQNLKVRQDVLTPSTTLSTTEALEQQVRAHLVVQEVMRLFDARIVAIERTGTSDGAGRPALEQKALCFSS